VSAIERKISSKRVSNSYNKTN